MFISTGSFIIRGKRNFLQPQRLELGFTLMFCISEESLANHMGERHCREDKFEIEDAPGLARAESYQSAATEEDQQEKVGRSVIDDILKSQASFTSGIAFEDMTEDDRITVVQVGEKAKDANKLDTGRTTKQA